MSHDCPESAAKVAMALEPTAANATAAIKIKNNSSAYQHHIEDQDQVERVQNEREHSSNSQVPAHRDVHLSMPSTAGPG